MTYQSAIDTLYEPKAITTISTERLSEAFLKYDRVLKDGMSRLLILRVMEKVSIKFLKIIDKGWTRDGFRTIKTVLELRWLEEC